MPLEPSAAPSKLEEIAYLDQLLGLPNLRAFTRDTQPLLQEETRWKGTVLKLYLEDFKFFNETFGHQYGDVMLSNVAAYLKETGSGPVYRIGGVEFALLLENLSYSASVELADDICERFSRAWHINDVDCVCSVSMGMVRLPGAIDGVEDLLSRLDHAVSESSGRGVNQLTVYDSALEQQIFRRNTIAMRLKEALADESLEIRFRPTYHMAKKCFTRAETYLVLHTPDFGPVYEAEFLPIAEASGLVCAVDIQVIRRVCAILSDLLRQGVPFENVAVRISPIQLLQEGFVEDLDALLREQGVPAEKLALEISESVLITANSSVNITMQELSEMGVELILNNFGTGYSGITSIIDLPVQTLKLDRLFVWQLEDTPDSSSVLLGGLTDIAQRLGLKVIAEGVETQNQIDRVTGFGCDYQQGFYYSPTITAQQLAGVLGSSKDA